MSAHWSQRTLVIGLVATIAFASPHAGGTVVPEPDDETPWTSAPMYELPAKLTGIEKLDVVVQTDPTLALFFEEFMFDFDEGCWETFGESSGPMSIPAKTVWAEHHAHWWGDYEVEPMAAATPLYTLAPADDEADVKLAFDKHAWTLAQDVKPAWEYGAAAPSGMLYEPTTYDNYPVTGMLLDTRYWHDEAAWAFVDCVYADYLAAAAAFAGQTGALVPAAPGWLPDWATITGCYADIEASVGDPCLAADESLCTDLEWHASWCGRREWEAHGTDPSWVCAQALNDAADDFLAQSGAVAEPLMLPETTYRDGDELRHDLERAMGVRIPLATDAGYDETDVYASDASLDPTIAAAEEAERIAWAANGEQVFSCEEYGHERYKDMSDLQWSAKHHQRDERWVFDAAFYGRDGIGPYVTSLPTKPDFRDGSGDLVWLNFPSYLPDDGFVPWTRADRFAPEEQRRRHRLFATFAPGWPHDTRLHTFKNVYYYLHRLRKGADAGFAGDCDDWRTELRSHYTVNTGWHRMMDATAAAEGFLDEEMEFLRDEQDALWKIYSDYLVADDPADREELTLAIDEALREGYHRGCIPWDPATPTPCDWAPSLFVEGVFETAESWRTHDREKCVSELGEAPFTTTELHEKFVDLTGMAAPLPPPWDQFIEDSRNAALSRDYTASTAALGTYFIDMEGLGNSWGYRDLVLQALSELGDDALVDSTDYEKTMGGEFFGVSMQHLSTAQTGAQPAMACTTVPAMDGLDAVTMRLGPFNREFVKAISNLNDYGSTIAPGPVQNPSYSPWGFSQDYWVGGELTHEPGVGTTLSGGIGYQAGWTISYNYAIPLASSGYVTLKLRLGASGSATASASFQAAYTWLSDDDKVPQATEEELAMNGGVPICEDVHTSQVTFNVTPGVRASGSVALGAGIGYILEVGIKGTLTLIDLSLPVSYSITTSNNNPTRSPRVDKDLTVDLVLTLLAGEISLYVALDIVITSIPIFELVLARWHGLKIQWGLLNDHLQGGDFCITAELAVIGKTLAGFESDPCPCRLRPADCHG